MLPHVPLITLRNVGQGAGDPQARDARQAVDHGSATLYYAVLQFSAALGPLDQRPGTHWQAGVPASANRTVCALCCALCLEMPTSGQFLEHSMVRTHYHGATVEGRMARPLTEVVQPASC